MSSDFFINLWVQGKLVPITKAELAKFFRVEYTADNIVPEDMPEIQEQLQRGQKYYSDPESSSFAGYDQNQNLVKRIPQSGVAATPEFLYLKPLEMNSTVQLGLYTSEAIPEGTWVGQYSGKLLPKSYPSRSLYAILLEDKHAGVAMQIDAVNHGNHIRFMNHSSEPNVKAHSMFYQGMYYIAMITTKAIEPNQQLVYSYSTQYWDALGILPDVL